MLESSEANVQHIFVCSDCQCWKTLSPSSKCLEFRTAGCDVLGAVIDEWVDDWDRCASEPQFFSDLDIVSMLKLHRPFWH